MGTLCASVVKLSDPDLSVSTVEERSFVEVARREKRAALEALGVQPFAYRYERTHTAAEALAAYRDEMGENGPEVSIAGRIESWRPKGKVVFGHLEDPSGRIQVYFRRDDAGRAVRAGEPAGPRRSRRREGTSVPDQGR